MIDLNIQKLLDAELGQGALLVLFACGCNVLWYPDGRATTAILPGCSKWHPFDWQGRNSNG